MKKQLLQVLQDRMDLILQNYLLKKDMMCMVL